MNFKMKKYILLFIGLGMLFASCDDFLNRQSPSKIMEEDFFKTEKDLQLYTNMLVDTYLPSAANLTRGDQYSDYTAVSNRERFLQANFSADQQGGWSAGTSGTWNKLYRVNLLLTKMERAKDNVSPEIYNHYEGVGRFWRAHFYFDIVKDFSDVPWYDTPIDPEDKEALYKGRDSREFVMQKVLEDINFAAQHCLTGSAYLNNSLINKYVALAMKSRICLYEGTFRKYHSVNPATNKPWSTEYATADIFLREAANASEELLNSSPYALASDLSRVSSLYRSFFNSLDLNKTETIWGRQFDGELARHDVTLMFNATGNQTNRWSPTKEFVNTYLNLDGTPFTSKPDYNKIMFQDEFKNRDYRMIQTLMGPGFTKKISGSVRDWAPNLTITYTGYQIIKYNIDDDAYETVSNCYNSLPILRMGEVALNYAEAKYELNEFDENVWNKTIKPLRERAGVNGKMPTQVDSYMAEYFDNSITNMYLLEIRRERGIELFYEGLRWDDLMRWAQGNLFKKTWSSMYIPEKNKVYDLTGNGVTKFALVDTAPSQAEAGVIYIELSKRPEYTYTADGLLIVNNSDIVWENRKYVRPIPTAAVVKNPNLGQNYGWEK